MFHSPFYLFTLNKIFFTPYTEKEVPWGINSGTKKWTKIDTGRWKNIHR